MGDISLIQSIGIMMVVAALVVLILRRANIPTIVLYIVTGLLLGPVLGVFGGDASELSETGPIELIGDLGIVLLLFLVGLELSLEKIRDVGKVAVVAGIGQVIFTAFFGFIFAWLLRFSVMESIFISTALTFSSTVVVVKLLDQKKELVSLYGRIAVGIFLVQDLVVIVALTFLAGLGSGEDEAARTIGPMIWGLSKAFVGMGLLLGVALLSSKYLLVKPFEWAARSPETLVVWSLCWCFTFVLAAELLGLSEEIGAFLAGVSLAQLGCAHDLRRRVHPLMNFFIAIFFIYLGAQMELAQARALWFPAIVLSLFVLIGNPFIFMWIIAKSGYSERTSFMTSVTVAQISEFSFIFAAMGVSAGLIDSSILSLVAVVGLITIVVSAYMILYNHVLYDVVRRMGLLRIFGASQEDDDDASPPMTGHIVVIGMNDLGRGLVRALHERGEQPVAVDTDAHKLRGLPGTTIMGNIEHPATEDDLSLGQAKLVVSTLSIEETNNLLAYRCRQLGVPCAIHAFDRSVSDDLRELGVQFQIDSKGQGNVVLATKLHEKEIMPT